jgi:hypothetical protein
MPTAMAVTASTVRNIDCSPLGFRRTSGIPDNPGACLLFLKTTDLGERGKDHELVNGIPQSGRVRAFAAAIRPDAASPPAAAAR